MKDDQFVEFDKNSESSTAKLYKSYCQWCEINGLTEMKKETFSSWLKQNKAKYGLTYSDHIVNGKSKKARGYCGIKILK